MHWLLISGIWQCVSWSKEAMYLSSKLLPSMDLHYQEPPRTSVLYSNLTEFNIQHRVHRRLLKWTPLIFCSLQEIFDQQPSCESREKQHTGSTAPQEKEKIHNPRKPLPSHRCQNLRSAISCKQNKATTPHCWRENRQWWGQFLNC